MTPITLDDEYSYPLHSGGSIGSLSSDTPEQDPVLRLHACIAEVTGKPVEAAKKPRMGFLA